MTDWLKLSFVVCGGIRIRNNGREAFRKPSRGYEQTQAWVRANPRLGTSEPSLGFKTMSALGREQQVQLFGAVMPKLGCFIRKLFIKRHRINPAHRFQCRYAKISCHKFGHARYFPRQEEMHILLCYFSNATSSARTNLTSRIAFSL